MNLKTLFCFLSISIFTTNLLFSQISKNVTLFGQLNPEPIHYAGSWGWTSPTGEEYALIGAFTGTSIISIDDSLNIQEVDFISGPSSNWREITVLNDYAYVVTEGSGFGEGMQVISLVTLPDSVSLVTTYSQTFGKAHIIGRDIYSDSNYVYVDGTQTLGGVHILDVSDPANPIEVGDYSPYYIHDSHIRGNRLYASAFYNGTLDIVDISDKTNPTLLTQISYPNPFTHSCWTSQDEKFLFVTDEEDGTPARIWNIEDLNNIYEVAQYSANFQSLVHNPYILGDFVYITHNTEGLRVVDIADPSVPIEVGFYDTYSGPSGGFHGLWSAFPYFPSQKIIGANRADGLYIFEFNQTHAGRIYGTVVDSLTNIPIQNTQITIGETGRTTTTNNNGFFKIGELPSSEEGFLLGYTLNLVANGYNAKSLTNVVLSQSDSLFFEIKLVDSSVSVRENPNLPTSVKLEQNFPNPFNPNTTINYELQISSFELGKLIIFNTQGEEVKEFDLEEPKGSIVWNGRNNLGKEVASGTYFYQIKVGDFSQTKKMIFLK